MRVLVSAILLCLVSWACESSSTPAATATDTATTSATNATVAYNYEAIPGSDTQLATRKDATGKVLESGNMRNGKKNGTWSYFESESTLPTKVITFVDDIYNGVYFQFNDRGQVELMANYKNNQLHGAWGKYRFNRPEATANYTDGVLDGVYREYDFKNGKLKKEVSYQAGTIDGIVRDYDEEGNVMVEYLYKNGEKISGGAVSQ